MRIFICFIISILLTFFITPLFRRLALRFDIVDRPGTRKIHKDPVPLLGGAAIALTVVVCSLLKPFIVGKGLPLLLGGIAILLINTLDDIRGLSARLRFAAELVVVLLMIKHGIKVSFLPAGFWGDAGEVLLTVIWFLGITNAFNYLDGLDGLAAGSACINFFYFSLVLMLTDQWQLGFLSLILLGSCLGFLPHNFRKAKIFLGDAGATFLGFMLAGTAILGEWAGDGMVKLCVPVLILGVPIFDMIFTTILRIKEKKVTTVIEWLKYGGKDHFHHYLIYLGLTKKGAVVFIWIFTLALGLGAVMLHDDTAWQGLLTLLQNGLIFAIIGVLIVVGKRRRSGWTRPAEGDPRGEEA